MGAGQPVVIDAKHQLGFRWSFDVYAPGLWLLDHSLATNGGERDGFVRIENLEINGAAPRRTHVE